jgi:hypothetical protein
MFQIPFARKIIISSGAKSGDTLTVKCRYVFLENVAPAVGLLADTQIFIKKKTGVAVSGTRPCVLREYVYVNG